MQGKARVDIEPVRHRNMAHMLNPADDKSITISRLNRHRCRVYGTHAATAEPIDRLRGHRVGYASDYRRHASNIEALFFRLLNTTPDNVFEVLGIERWRAV